MESGFPVTGDQSGDAIKTFADSLTPGFLREISSSMQWVTNFLVKLEIMDAVKDLEDLRCLAATGLRHWQGINLGSKA
jgi:hypothetical protein